MKEKRKTFIKFLTKKKKKEEFTMIKVSKEKLTKDDKVLLKRYIIDLCQKQRFENNLERDYDIDTIEKDLYDMNVIDSLTTKCYNKVFCELLHKNLI